jgi:hypothetical protein
MIVSSKIKLEPDAGCTGVRLVIDSLVFRLCRSELHVIDDDGGGG